MALTSARVATMELQRGFSCHNRDAIREFADELVGRMEKGEDIPDELVLMVNGAQNGSTDTDQRHRVKVFLRTVRQLCEMV